MNGTPIYDYKVGSQIVIDNTRPTHSLSSIIYPGLQSSVKNGDIFTATYTPGNSADRVHFEDSGSANG